MKIYLAHSSKMNFIDDLYRPIQQSIIDKNHDVIYFCEDPEYKNKSSKEAILSSDLVVADMTEPSTGMGIEVGWADMMAKPIIVVHKKDTKISGYIGTIAMVIVEHVDSIDLVEKLAKVINDKI